VAAVEPIPVSLEVAVRAALGAMRAAPGHELTPEYRRGIYAAFGPRVQEPVPDRARGHLAVLTAKHVSPLFERHQLYDDWRPAYLIALGEDVLKGIASYEEAATMLHAIKGGQWPNPDMHPAGRAAGWAALSAVDEVLGYNGLDYDYDGTDTADCAARAVCDGWAFPHKKEPEKLQAFWEWWLLEAIPAAWQHAQDPR
jgi:hypothetical protein